MGPARLVPQLGWFALQQVARLALLQVARLALLQVARLALLDFALLDSALLARQVSGLDVDAGRLALLSGARLGTLPASRGELLILRSRAGAGRRLGGALEVRDDRGGVDGRRSRQCRSGQSTMSHGADGRPVAVGQGSAWVGTGRVLIRTMRWLGAGDQVDEWPQVGAAYLENVIALLAQWPRDRPVPVHGDMHENDPDPEVLHLGDHLGKILFAADEDSVGDRPVSGQGVQVTVHP